MNIDIKPIGFVKTGRTLAENDFWGGERHPRNNLKWPALGIFAQRGKNRPNRIGSTICRIVRVGGTHLFVSQVDAIDVTPVLDIKRVLAEFLPRQEIRQPAWSHDLMRDYWQSKP